MRAGWWVGVVVPARDEEATVGPCVDSVRGALHASGVPGAIVVVADGCSDDTVGVATAALAGAGEVVRIAAANVGAAREAGAARLLERARAAGWAPDQVWLATSDADGTVPPHWLRAQLRLADRGAAAVAGVVRVLERGGSGDASEAGTRRHVAAYASTLTATGHPHVHGANLGLRADAYLDAGGWRALRTAEDHDLWDRLRARGWTAISSIESWVTTSDRRDGRAPDGFAADLRSADLELLEDAP